MSKEELESMSDDFIMSQIEYYKKHLGYIGNGSLTVLGLFQLFRGEAVRRGLLIWNEISGSYVKV